MLGDCQNLAFYLYGVFWPPPTWLPSDACMSKRATKDDEETQSDADLTDKMVNLLLQLSLTLCLWNKFLRHPLPLQHEEASHKYEKDQQERRYRRQ